MQAVWTVTFLSCVLVCSAANINTGDGVEDAEAVITVKREDIKYFFCNQQNPEGVLVKYDNISAATQIFDTKKETLILIHGWMNGNNSDFNTVVKDAVFSTLDINVIVVDWSKVAKGEYLTVKTQMPKVSEYIRDALKNFTSDLDYSATNVKMVGHSLGAHVCGFVGKQFGGNVTQIFGLDPAGPFISDKDGHRLDKDDAKFVEIIHTSRQFGMSEVIGHADYYPNGGKAQPGCHNILGKCAHDRAYQLYAESVKSGGFWARKCSNYSEFEDKKCKGELSLMGGFKASRATGTFFLDTNSESPYAKGKIDE